MTAVTAEHSYHFPKYLISQGLSAQWNRYGRNMDSKRMGTISFCTLPPAGKEAYQIALPFEVTNRSHSNQLESIIDELLSILDS